MIKSCAPPYKAFLTFKIISMPYFEIMNKKPAYKNINTQKITRSSLFLRVYCQGPALWGEGGYSGTKEEVWRGVVMGQDTI